MILKYQDDVEKKQLPVDVVEILCANPVKIIYTSFAKALNASNIQINDWIEAQKRIESVLDSIVLVQNKIMNEGRENTKISNLPLSDSTIASNFSIINSFITHDIGNILQEFMKNF